MKISTLLSILGSLSVLLFPRVGLAAPTVDTLSCLSKRRIAEVRKAPAAGIRNAYSACHAEFASKTASLKLTESQAKVAFLSVLAHAMAPYGNSVSLKLDDLLADKVMDCDNYIVLTGHFTRLFLGKTNVTTKFVGFDGGAVGNHAQLIVEDNGDQLLLDPTIGLVAKVSFNDLLMGKSVPDERIRLFKQHPDKTLDTFIPKVAGAVSNGSYRPSDMLYYFPSLDEYLAFSDETAPLWKSDVDALLRRFPTPGSQALRKNLGK